MLQLELNEDVPICLLISDGSEIQYPQAIVTDSDNNSLAIINLAHDANGVYVPSAAYPMPDETFIKVAYVVYSDKERTNENTSYQRDLDVFYQVETNTKLSRVLGLLHENIYIDNPSYDSDDNLVSARVRIYSDASSVGTTSNVIGTYEITSAGDGAGKFTYWKQIKS